MASAHRQGLFAALALTLKRHGAASASPEPMVFGDAEVDLRRAIVRRDGRRLELPSLELKLLRYFIDHHGAVLTRGELLDRVWGYEVAPRSRTVDVHVASLRRKLERDPARPELIRTVYGLGYKFVG